MELFIHKLPENTYNCPLNTLNYLMCVFNVVVPAIVWIYDDLKKYEAGTIVVDI